MRTRRPFGIAMAAAACALAFAAGTLAGQAGQERTFVSPTGATLRLLLDEATLGSGDVEVAELTFPAGGDSGDHVHGSTEIFYVLSGELEHVVNGKSTRLGPGEVGFVRPPDTVRHKTAAETRALVIWVPGGEAERITTRWTEMGRR